AQSEADAPAVRIDLGDGYMIGQTDRNVRQLRIYRLLALDGDDAVLMLQLVRRQIGATGKGQHHPREPVMLGSDELCRVGGSGNSRKRQEERQKSGMHQDGNLPLPIGRKHSHRRLLLTLTAFWWGP